MLAEDPHATLNPAQREAVLHRGVEPLLIIAGAGTGKTTTLAHRLAQLILDGADPRRVLLLTFSRRAAQEMTRRALRVVAAATRATDLPWAGTFHAIANRLLRLHAPSLGLDPSFTVLDRGDAADLLDLVRGDLELGRGDRRFPRKDTCLGIYSRTVNAQAALEAVLDEAYPWCREHADALRALFRGYVEVKQRRRVLDYDDLLLWWFHAMSAPSVAAAVRSRFDAVLVDEYQDTNVLQAEIVVALAPEGRGLTAVGDDAQAIYSFRAATVRNILDFPARFPVPARLVALEDNYRSTVPIVEDEPGQVAYVVERVLAHREQGLRLRDQAVLFRTAHHSDALEIELARRRIPFVKYGGLKFLEAAHVKDALAFLRWAENPVDPIAGFRVAQLLPGIGPRFAKKAIEAVAAAAVPSLAVLATLEPPAAARARWPALCELLLGLADPATPWPGQLGRVRRFYDPLMAELYDAPHVRAGDLEQLELVAGAYRDRGLFLAELTLDPPDATGDQAGPPLLDEDWLVLSTIHSAKGQEWKAVFVLQVVDGCIPSDMSTGHAAQIEEERRLLYVAMTRARDHLHLVQPLRMYVTGQHRHGDRHVYVPRSRFLPEEILGRFERVVKGRAVGVDAGTAGAPVIDVAGRMRAMWS